MTGNSVAATAPEAAIGVGPSLWWRSAVPLAAIVAIALLPAPAGLGQHAWYYFAVFVGVVLGLMLEPLPGAMVGLLGVTTVSILCRWVFFSPAEQARPGFDAAGAVVKWALAGFSNSSVWLIVGAFMFTLGYEQSGLGRRIALLLIRAMGRRTLTLGYALVAIETLLAPFVPSVTARTGGIIYPVMRNLPPLYGSMPNEPSARWIGSYLMWTVMAASCVTSSLFLTAFAPNLLALEFLKKTANIEIGWGQWFLAFAPVGVPLLLALPALVYVVYPPRIRQGTEVVTWAGEQIAAMGPVSRRELVFGLLVLLGLALWIFGGAFVNATTVVLIVLVLMVLTKVTDWRSVTENKVAWGTLVWFATLISMADGLNQTGFVAWFAHLVASHLQGVSPVAAVVALVSVFFLSHYLFASVTAHATAMLPVILAVGAAVPGVPVATLAQMLVLTLGIMGIITPYGAGPSPIFAGSGYLPARDFWRLGTLFGALYLVLFLLIGLPTLLLPVL